MSRHKSAAGFTLVELLVVIAVLGVVLITFSSFFTNYLILYSKYQTDGSNFSELASQSQRIADVLRGLTDIVSESSNDLVIYAYFSPVDSFVSQVHYYVGNNGKSLYADVTPMTANPPTGSLLTAQTKTYTIISNYYQPAGGSLFNYFDASDTPLSLPISDEHTIMDIQVNLSTQSANNKTPQNLAVTVSLRNRKTNL